MSALLARVTPRQDGPAKVTGAARYAADHFAEDMLYGVVVGAPAPAGRLRGVDAAAALEIPGVTHVLTHEQMPKLGAPPVPPASSVRVPLQDDEIRYEGEPIAIVLAQTLEAAEYAASLVEADVESGPSRRTRAATEPAPRSRARADTCPGQRTPSTATSLRRSPPRRCTTRRRTSSLHATTTRWSPRRRWPSGETAR